MTTVRLKVPTIKCAGCVQAIRTALAKLPAVQAVEGNPERKEVTVRFDPDKLSEREIRAAIATAGFLVG